MSGCFFTSFFLFLEYLYQTQQQILRGPSLFNIKNKLCDEHSGQNQRRTRIFDSERLMAFFWWLY